MSTEAPKNKNYELIGLDREDVDLIHIKAREVLNICSFYEDDFIDDPYDASTVERDKAYVKRVKEQIERKQTRESLELKQLADIFEAIVLEHGELSEWFGENAFTLATSAYDDLHGVDMVVEFREGASASYLGLAADVTFSGNPHSSDSIRDKFDRLLARISSGDLPSVKYFKSAHIPIKGKLEVPEVIIGVEKATVLELAELWNAKKNSILSTHRVQIMILEQILEQLVFIAKYARRADQDRIANLYEQRLGIISQILEEKKNMVGQATKEHRVDEVHKQIMGFLSRRLQEFDDDQ